MKLAISLGLVLAMTGCATKPISESEALPVPTDHLLAYQDKTAGTSATLVTMRDSTGGGCNMEVYIDGTLGARIGDGMAANFYLAPGDHTIGTGPTDGGTCARYPMQGGLRVTMKEGETKQFRISIDPNSGPIFILMGR